MWRFVSGRPETGSGCRTNYLTQNQLAESPPRNHSKSKREELETTTDKANSKKKETKCLNCGLVHDSAQFVKDVEADSTALAISLAREREEKGLSYVV